MTQGKHIFHQAHIFWSTFFIKHSRCKFWRRSSWCSRPALVYRMSDIMWRTITLEQSQKRHYWMERITNDNLVLATVSGKTKAEWANVIDVRIGKRGWSRYCLQDVWEHLENEEEGIETDSKRRCEELIWEGGGFSMVHNVTSELVYPVALEVWTNDGIVKCAE